MIEPPRDDLPPVEPDDVEDPDLSPMAGWPETLPEEASPPQANGDNVPLPLAELTLWDVLAQGIRAPRQTWRWFWEVVNTPPDDPEALEAELARLEAAEAEPYVPAHRPPRLSRSLSTRIMAVVTVLMAAAGIFLLLWELSHGGRSLALGAPFTGAAMLLGILQSAIPYQDQLRKTVYRVLPFVRRRVQEEVEFQDRMPFILAILALVLALVGSFVMDSGENRTEERQLNVGAPWLIIGFTYMLTAGMVEYQDFLRRWGGGIRDRFGGMKRKRAADEIEVALENAEPEAVVFTPETEIVPPLAEEEVEDLTSPERPVGWGTRLVTGIITHAARLTLAVLGVLLGVAAWVFNGGITQNTANAFTEFGVFVWIASVFVWLAVLTPPSFDAVAWVQARREAWRERWAVLSRGEIRIRVSWTLVFLVAIMLIGTYFRVAQFENAPPELTSDHIEKLINVREILNGQTSIFFVNNGGRESLHMYFLAFLSRVTGLGLSFDLLKWGSILEGLITIPALWWMGRQLIDDDEPGLGNVVGLILAGLVAVSYWHVALSRLALRIVLTPLVMALVMGYLARALRHNRRGDFLKAGLALGVGLYCYQAVRMIPVIIVLGVIMAIVFRARTWGERRRYLGNLAALVIIAVVIFIPLGRFMIEFPNSFWSRTQGRFFGDDIITETDPETGELREREASLQDRIDAFGQNLPVLGSNIRNALLMYNWKGDVAWINGVPNEPAMDIFTGSLLIIGLAIWLVRLFRGGDVADWLVLPAIFVMLLPSALSIAYPMENPSATRTSGTLPLVYLIAAYGAAMIFTLGKRAVRGRIMPWLVGAVIVALTLGAFGLNSNLYFDQYVTRYRNAWKPHSVAGRVLRGFAESTGAYGNAFMVHTPHWFDHRIIGIEAGVFDWPNGLLSLDELAQRIRDNYSNPEFAFDHERAVLFFYSQDDTTTPEILQEWFPDGESIYESTGNPAKDFYIFVAPPPGEAWLRAFLGEQAPATPSG